MDKSQTRVRPGFIVGLVVVFVVTPILAGYVLPVYVGGKPTPGERAELQCRNYLEFAKFSSSNGKFSFDFAKLSVFEGSNHWFSPLIFSADKEYLAKTNFYLNSSIEGPVILCKQRFFYRQAKNSFGCSFVPLKPAYAVGYPDGTARLISEDEFTNLNLSGFVSLSNLATNSEFNIFK
jgi:hypothetical protein